MRYLLTLVLALAGCCPHERVRLEGSSERSVLLFDPDTGKMFWMDLATGKVIREYR